MKLACLHLVILSRNVPTSFWQYLGSLGWFLSMHGMSAVSERMMKSTLTVSLEKFQLMEEMLSSLMPSCSARTGSRALVKLARASEPSAPTSAMPGSLSRKNGPTSEYPSRGNRMTWTSATDGATGASSMVMPNTLQISLTGFVCKANAAFSTFPAVSVATTVRITLPALTVTVSKHTGKKHFNCWRKLVLIKSAFASYSSTPPPAFSTKVTALAGTISLVAPGCNGEGGGGEGEGEGGGGGGEGEGGGGGGEGGNAVPPLHTAR